MNTIKIINGKVITPQGIKEDATIIIKDSIIKSIPEGIPNLADSEIIDAKGSFISPGLVDIQINGYIGESNQSVMAEWSYLIFAHSNYKQSKESFK